MRISNTANKKPSVMQMRNQKHKGTLCSLSIKDGCLLPSDAQWMFTLNLWHKIAENGTNIFFLFINLCELSHIMILNMQYYKFMNLYYMIMNEHIIFLLYLASQKELHHHKLILSDITPQKEFTSMTSCDPVKLSVCMPSTLCAPFQPVLI